MKIDIIAFAQAQPSGLYLIASNVFSAWFQSQSKLKCGSSSKRAL